MNKKGKTRALLSASVLLMLSAGLLVGGTYALFSDEVKVTNHLVAGNLNISLLRTHLDKHTLDNTTGYSTDISDDTVVDFTDATDKNIFGLESDELVVPTSYFEATLKIVNGIKNADTSTYVPSSVAFDYGVKVNVNDTSDDDLIDQLYVTVSKFDGESFVNVVDDKKLKDFETSAIFAGVMDKTDTEQAFKVKLEFKDLDNPTNNLAQGEIADFDLVVEAIQKTTPSA